MLLVYEALSYRCMRPDATDVLGLILLGYEALSYMRLSRQLLEAGGADYHMTIAAE